MDFSQVRWLKNVKPDQGWAYQSESDIQMMESRIFQLHWKSKDDSSVALPQKGDLMVLVQQARVSHIVEILNDRVYGNDDEWAAYRVVQAIWMPPINLDWYRLPHQKEIFGIESLPQDGSSHRLDQDNKMHQFNQYWKEKGGVEGFRQNLAKVLSSI